MVSVKEYKDNGVVRYVCSDCEKNGEVDISSKLADNCALSIPITCDHCGSSRLLYVLVCKDVIYAKELISVLSTFKDEGGDTYYVDPKNQENRDYSIQIQRGD